jgi:hypothetical protein
MVYSLLRSPSSHSSPHCTPNFYMLKLEALILVTVSESAVFLHPAKDPLNNVDCGHCCTRKKTFK